MLALSALQSTVAAAITAHAYFAAAPAIVAIADDGTSKTALETQLRTRGFAVLVMPLLGLDIIDNGATTTTTGEAELLVTLLLNPHSNASPSGAGRTMPAAIVAALEAVLSWQPPTPGDRRFRIDPKSVRISAADEGLLSYDLIFRKQVTLN